ncbi:tetratricopeptide repeat protein [Seonamhaeicola sp. ML3]|uniref:tetratricopeptide repeat protein n=1 Tax=Seonamhaeicola sp. ML3 TaxID=2937786 RepID=UPI0020104F1B|nr:tetratricopeptide repeat protein [Seonamhaeicola sp. ML3]
MKFKFTLFFVCFLINVSLIFAQKDIECKTKLSLFHQDVTVKNFDIAYDNWKFVKDSCPELNIAIYSDGEKILKHKIERTKGEARKRLLNELLGVWESRLNYFPNKTPKGQYSAKSFQLKYDNRDVLEKSTEELYHGFDNAFQMDKKTFNHPKALYTYFSLIMELNEAGKKSLKEVFDKYDDINDKIENEVKNYSLKLNKLVEKQNKKIPLNKTEIKAKSSYKNYLKNYSLVSENINKMIATIADCSNLIQLYTKDFEAHKKDSIWLKRAVSRMYHKECTEDPLYEKLAIAYDEVAPSADTKFFVAIILVKKGKTEEAMNYLAKAYELETDTFKKSKLANRIGFTLMRKADYSRARIYYRRALKLNPSNGRPHLAIASMYAMSANNCGKDEFEKRAVYWLAANEARKALIVDPTIKQHAERAIKRYEALAPSKEMIFLCACSGKEIKFSCWINKKVVVPTIKK